MDQILSDRYTILVANYPVDNHVLAELRTQILKNLHSEYQLRPDAALALISLFDQMIIRPYHGPLHSHYYADRFSWSDKLTFPIPSRFTEMNDEKFLELCISSLGKILGTAKKDDEGEISSHSILRSIDANWRYLSEIFGWA